MEKINKMLHIYKTAEETIKALADYFVQIVNATIKEKGRCAVMLSGGK
jgi:6-phosphogluconolactonase/glucosamine-6-phosphate isomerase/deaminase